MSNKNKEAIKVVEKIEIMINEAKCFNDFKKVFEHYKIEVLNLEDLCFCRLHNRLEPYKNMVIAKNGKSTGVCKAANNIWQRRIREIYRLEGEIESIVRIHVQNTYSFNKGIDYKDYELPEVKELKAKIATLRKELNSVKSYDFDKDWQEYNNKRKRK